MIRNLTNFATNLPAVFFRKNDVKKNYIGVVELKAINTCKTVAYGFNLIALFFKIIFKSFSYLFILRFVYRK